MEQEEIKVQEQKPKSTAKILAGVSLGLTIFAILLAGLFDFLAFKEAILTFLGGIIVTAAALIMLMIIFCITIIMIFGIIIVQNHGFWPMQYAKNIFTDVMGEVEFIPAQMSAFRIYRIVLIVICVAIIVLSIIALVKYKKELKLGIVKRIDEVKPMATTSLVLAIIGMLISIGAIVVTLGL